MMFLVVFMGSDKYVTSRYLRAKLADVLREWLPPGENTPSWRRNPSRRDAGSAMTHLFEGHPLVLQVGRRAWSLWKSAKAGRRACAAVL